MSAMLSAVAAPRRRKILELVWDQEVGAGEIRRAFPDVTFGAVSQHLKVLADAGAVEVRREGRRRFYSARKTQLGALGQWLEQMWDGSLGDLKTLAEKEQADG